MCVCQCAYSTCLFFLAQLSPMCSSYKARLCSRCCCRLTLPKSLLASPSSSKVRIEKIHPLKMYSKLASLVIIADPFVGYILAYETTRAEKCNMSCPRFFISYTILHFFLPQLSMSLVGSKLPSDTWASCHNPLYNAQAPSFVPAHESSFPFFSVQLCSKMSLEDPDLKTHGSFFSHKP